MKPKAILFNLWEKHFPVIKEFAEKNPEYLILVPYSGFISHPLCANFSGRIIPYENLLSPIETETLRFVAAEKSKKINKIVSDPTGGHWSEFCNRFQVDPTRLSTALFEDIENKLVQQISLIESLNKFLNLIDIRVVVVNEEYTLLPKTLVSWSSSNKIPVLHINHSLGMSGWYTVNDKMQSNYLAVYGNIVANAPMEIATSGEKIFISGNPDWLIYDQYLQHKSAIKNDLAQNFFNAKPKPIILFGTTFNANLTATEAEKNPKISIQSFFDALVYLKKKNIEFYGVIKLRPNNDPNIQLEYALLAKECGLINSEVYFVKNELEKWMLGSDIVVSVDSTLSADALMADTNAINLITEEGWRRGPYYPRRSGIVESSFDELGKNIENLLTQPELAQELKEYRKLSRNLFQGIPVNSNPTQYLAELISNIILKNETSIDHNGQQAQVNLTNTNTDSKSYKFTFVIKPKNSLKNLENFLSEITSKQIDSIQFIYLASNEQIQYQLSYPNVIFLDAFGSWDSQSVFKKIIPFLKSDKLIFIDPDIRFSTDWESEFFLHKLNDIVYAPIINNYYGSQSIYQYFSKKFISNNNFKTIAKVVNDKFSKQYKMTEWIDPIIFGITKEFFSQISEVPDASPQGHYFGINYRLMKLKAKLVISKGCFGYDISFNP